MDRERVRVKAKRIYVIEFYIIVYLQNLTCIKLHHLCFVILYLIRNNLIFNYQLKVCSGPCVVIKQFHCIYRVRGLGMGL